MANPYANPIESPSLGFPAMRATMEASTFEATPPGEPIPTTVIRADQNWGVNVNFEWTGVFVTFMPIEWRITAFLEGMGLNSELSIPVGAPGFVSVNGLNNATCPLGTHNGIPQRTCSSVINVTAGQVGAGTYKLVTTIQAYNPFTGTPYPVAGFVEGSIIQVYNV